VTDLIIPAQDEEEAIGMVVQEVPRDLISEIVVINNASKDNTAQVASKAGATVIDEPRKGYGQACLTGIKYLLGKSNPPDIIAFMDGDHSDYPEQVSRLIEPIESGQADIVIGSRALGNQERGAMFPQQRFGNWLAALLIRIIYDYRISDLGPFRAISTPALKKIGMTDTNYGWTVEMQIKAIQHGLTMIEVPVDYRKRIGHSKIAGTVKGTVRAGYKIIHTIFKYSGSK
jgi:glycosyltransferase involved in cell wall biosynthesis